MQPIISLSNQLLKKKTLGDIYYVKKRVSYFNIRDDWQSQKKNFGGIENAVLIHHIDQILNLFGSNYISFFITI